MMCVLGWLHPINAQTILEVGNNKEGTTFEVPASAASDVPASISQQIYWLEELKTAGLNPGDKISHMTFTAETLGTPTVNWSVYIKETHDDYLYDSRDYEVFDTDPVYSGEITAVNNEFSVPVNYTYQGVNILICVIENGGTGNGNSYYKYDYADDAPGWGVGYPTIRGKSLGTFTASNPTDGLLVPIVLEYKNYLKLTIAGASEPQPLSVTFSAAKENIYSDETTTLKAEAKDGTGNYNYSWTPATGLSATNVANPTFTPPSTGIYTFNCEVTDGETTKQGSVTVNVTERPANPYAGKQYRIKVNSSPSSYYYDYNGWYLHVNNHDAPNNNPNVGIVSSQQESDNQIFTIEANGSGQYYLKTADGYYIKCATGSQWWCVYAYSATEKTPLVLEYLSNGVEFYIKDYDKMMGNGGTNAGLTTNNYFKVQNSSIYCDASPGKDDSEGYVCTWVLEEVAAPEFTLELTANSTSVCEGNTVGLEANTKNAVGDCTYSWTPTTGLDDPDSATPTFTSYDIDQASEVVTFTCTATDSEGNEINATIDITINDAPEFVDLPGMITINAGETAIIPVKYDEDQYSFYVESTPYLDYTHYGYNYDDKDYDGCELSVLNLESDTELAITIYPIYGGCQATSTVNIKVIDESKEVVIGENNAVGNVYLPVRTESAYSLTQQIYTAEELGINERSNINSISFYATWSNGTARDIEVYLANTALESFPTGNPSPSSDLASVLSDDFVNMNGAPNFDDEVTFTQGSWTTINFTTPFEYEPGKNIIVCVNDKTGSTTGGFEFASYTRDGLRSISMYGSNAYTPSAISAAGYTPTWDLGYNNQIKLGYEAIADATLSAEIIADKTSLCDGDNSNRFNLTAKKIENATYEWYRGDVLLGNAREFVYSNENPGTYTIRLEVTQGGNMESTTIELTINEMPNVEFVAPNAHVGQTIEFTLQNPTEGANYTLVIYNDSDEPVSSELTPNNGVFTWSTDSYGAYHAKVTADNGGCVATSTEYFAVYIAASFGYEGTRCPDNAITFTAAQIGGVSNAYSWTIRNQQAEIVKQISYSNDYSFEYTFETAGVYEVELTNTTYPLGKDPTNSTFTDQITIGPVPEVTDITTEDLTIVSVPITFVAEGENIENTVWYINDEEITMPYTFETKGEYEVSVTVSSEAGCSTTFVETIEISDKLSVPKVSYRGEVIREAEGDVVDMSYRPAGAWMAPAEVVIEPDGSTPLMINSVEIVGDYFDFDGLILENFIKIVNETVVDKAVNPGDKLVVKLSHDKANEVYQTILDGAVGPEAGINLDVENDGYAPQLKITYSGDQERLVPIDYIAYVPDVADVFETAPVAENGTTYNVYNILPNYQLDGANDTDYDAVYKIELEEGDDLAVSVTTTGADPHIYIYKANFNGEEGPGKTNYISSTAASAMSEILESGEYYVVVSSSDSEFDVTINANQLEAPAQASNPAPHDRANVSLETAALTFTLADFSTEYQVLFGPDKNNMTALVNWTATATNAISIEMPALERNNVYYWKVNARNAAGTTEGELWYFATPFDGPVASIDKEEIMATTESALLSWTELVPTVKEYNIYADETKLHTITDAETLAYTLSNLPYNSEEYEIFVQVVFANDDLRITANSNKVTLRVSGKGGVYGYVYAEDGEPVANATVVFKGIEFKTNSDGYYEGEVWAGVYDAFVTGDNCKKKTQSVDVAYAGNTEINFILQYVLSMVKDVVATETVIDESVDVEWSYEIEPATVFDFENGELGSDIASFIEIYTYNDNTKESIYESTDYETPAYLIVEDANAPSGTHCIASNIQGQDNKSACITVVAALACDGTVSFYSKKLSETYDFARFYIDGVEQVYYPESDWIKSEYQIPAGTHTLKWSYVKDYSTSADPDALYIDNITISSNISYVGNIYVKDALTENAEPKLVKENIAVEDYIYTDSEWWATADDGIYKYGVSVEYNEDAIDLINEDFTSLQYWTTYDDNTEPGESTNFAWHVGTETTNGMQALSGNSVFTLGAEGANLISHFRYYLVSRKINASKQSNLTFSYIAPYWSAESPDWFNRFRVLYGTSERGPWTPLMDYNEAAVNSWTEVTLELPLMDNIYIAFESYNIYEVANDIYTGLGVGLDNVVVTAAERKGESNIAWSNMVAKGNQFFQDGEWNVKENWSRDAVPGNTSLAIISAKAQLTSDETVKMLFINEGEGKSLEIAKNGALTLTSSEVYNEDGAESLVINAGGQLVHDKEGVEATFVKSIQHYSGAEILDGWYTISSPLATNVDATEVNNMISGEYDLYRYDEPTHYWENYEDVNDQEPGDPDNEDWGKNGGVIEKGRGYLYANNTDTELSFVGELNTAQVSRTLSAQADALTGFNLLGNPFAHDIYKGAAFDKENDLRTGYYTLNYHGAWQAATDDIAIESGAGFLVQTDADQTINIDKVNTPVRRATNAMMAISVVNNQYEDVTYVSFKDGKGLEKIGHMNEYIPVVYVPYDFSAYAIATMSEDVTEIPVNFEAKTMGEYTFGVKTENCEYKVMTLVDNFTGKETNLLSDNYTFWATTTDEPNRFLIKLSKEDAQIEDSFIYIYNDELIFDNLSGDAIINVFDVLGRNVATFNNCGETTYRVSTDLFADGVYLVRLIEGNNVKVQKMVIE